MKRIHCLHCGEPLEVSDEIVDGQHILCPYCNKKFSYSRIEDGSEKPNSEKPAKRNWFGTGLLIIILMVSVIVIMSKIRERIDPEGVKRDRMRSNRLEFATKECKRCGYRNKYPRVLKRPGEQLQCANCGFYMTFGWFE